MEAQMMETAKAKLAMRFLKKAGMSRVAGEVRFIKDRGGDKNEWGWGTPPPSAREIGDDFEFDPKNLKPIAKCLRATSAAMGYALSAYDTFTRLKSAMVSPDGNLGGKGYIQKIPEMRRQYMNSIEALSALSDTLYDELHAPHWNPAVEEQSPRERDEVKDLINDADTIRNDPEAWAEGEEAEMDAENEGGDSAGVPKTASQHLTAVDRWDAATRWFDNEMNKLTSGDALKECLKDKIVPLLKQVEIKSGVGLKNAEAAAEDILDRMFDYTGDMQTWDQVADPFWTNSFYHFKDASATRLAQRYLQGRAA